MAHPVEVLRIAAAAVQIILQSLEGLAAARSDAIVAWAEKAGFNRERDELVCVTAPHAFAEPSDDYREMVFIVPTADGHLYDGQRIGPELMHTLRERYPSLMIRANPIITSKIVTKSERPPG